MSCIVSRLLTGMTPPVARQMPLTGSGHRGPARSAYDPGLFCCFCPPGPTELMLARMHVHPHRILHFHTHTHLHGSFDLGSARPDNRPRPLSPQITATRSDGT